MFLDINFKNIEKHTNFDFLKHFSSIFTLKVDMLGLCEVSDLAVDQISNV
jgi:hypothetical protein